MGTEQAGLTVPSHVLLESGPTNKARKAAVVVVVVVGVGRGKGPQAFVEGRAPGLVYCFVTVDLRVSCV